MIVSRLEQTLNRPMVVLVVGVVAVALNVLLYFGLFLPRMTPLIAQINPVGTSLLEGISKSGPQAPAPQDSSSGSPTNSPQGSPPVSPPPESPSGSRPPELPTLPTPPQQQY